ncbi:Gfo/Idh/MocA family oxidoreductase [Myxococcota bacterium]|nr:Gfo/Idh/MocA family oxidoreductase [Myxococcota bacterium]
MPATSELRWGILGTASIAPAIIRGIRAANAGVVAAVASRDATRAEAFATTHAIPRAFGSYDALLASGAVDVVYNPLPNTLHAPWTIAALRAGLPVLCEKPFAATLAEAREVAAVARETGLPVAEAFMYRFHPLYDRVRALIAAGELGALVTIRGHFTFALDDRSALPAQAALGGGALRDVGCYAVDLARQLSGAEPVRAIALARGRGVDDTLCGVLELASGVLAEVSCSIESFELHRAEVVGTKGAIVVDAPWFPGTERASFVLRRAGEPDVCVETPGGDGYALEAADFARAVVTGTAPRWPVEDALANAAAVDALLASAALGAAVRVEALDGTGQSR